MTRVFISYERSDETTARDVAQTLQSAGVPVYIDQQDAWLQVLDAIGDPEGVAGGIDEGVSSASHMLVIVGSNTKNSWWVPYEIGVARSHTLPVATLVLDEEVVLPHYLQITTILRDTNALHRWMVETFRVPVTEQLIKSASASIPRLPRVARGELRFVNMKVG